MSLKTFVKVGKITNLSDARYCAGMGVDMLGFRVIPTDLDYLTPERFKEFRGWFTGPLVVAEAYGIQSEEGLRTIIENYQPDYIELSLTELQNISALALPIILSANFNEVKETRELSKKFNIEYLILKNLPERFEQLPQVNDYKIIVEIEEENELNKVENHSTIISGISLKGSPEEKPGLKDYDALSSILERLESVD